METHTLKGWGGGQVPSPPGNFSVFSFSEIDFLVLESLYCITYKLLITVPWSNICGGGGGGGGGFSTFPPRETLFILSHTPKTFTPSSCLTTVTMVTR